ncbi:MAG: hypothetical protein COU11_00075 [Candidatus Harrisonbacteria bacterium CG10_big_fil_rev_8_21_14_0_10_49_15]|uniref:Uncharacterized protein n=1 Tax=Candidatus Harrisonbacteria bacterium CG10_big_fil_rev_8_21_14_0_10_49_15 TaxID=1974587 RepID=A0A2H0UM57_9BACT|nr:MAG: hypothetical protein COU11_00075 [Candidatus Harrisonbacteria bacterium CG10_big_fil_rev_8_21_14_0_10_49_15]
MENADTLESEISALEAKLAAKRAEAGGQNSEALPTKEHFDEVFKEHAGSAEQVGVSFTAPAANTNAGGQTGPRAVTPAETQKINDLITVSFTKGIQAAIKEAQRTGDAFFVDQLHDRLADEYYERLIAARKLGN